MTVVEHMSIITDMMVHLNVLLFSFFFLFFEFITELQTCAPQDI